jgi:hypothetical protein
MPTKDPGSAPPAGTPPTGEANVVDGRRAWSAYVRAIRDYASSAHPSLRDMIRQKLQEVDFRLRQLGGVVTKRHLEAKVTSGRLWRAEDAWQIDWARRRGGIGPITAALLAMPPNRRPNLARATSQYHDLFEVNPRFRHYDVHHIWPETLGGPTEGWNVLPLSKAIHLAVLHPILDDLVRQAQPGTRVQLV